MVKKKSISDKLIDEVQQIDMEVIEPVKKTLSQIATKLNTKFGKNGNKIELASKKKDLEIIPSNILAIDYALRGGFPRGRIVLLAGAESSYKSSITLRTMASAQKIGGTCAYIDGERTFSPGYSQAHGVDLEKLLIVEPETAEQAYNQLTQLILEGVDVIVLDSLNTLSVKKEIYADDKGIEIADIQVEAMGIAQRKTSQWLRNSLGRISKSKTLLLVICQLRDNLSAGLYGSPTTVVGGRAIKYASSVTIATRQLLGKANAILDENNEIVGKTYEFKLDKNKTGREGLSDQFTAYGGSMVDNYSTMLKIGLKEGFILHPNKLTYECNGIKYVGKPAILEALVDESTGVYTFCEKTLRHIFGTQIYKYSPYDKAKDIQAASEVPVNEDEDGVLIPDEELEDMNNNG